MITPQSKRFNCALVFFLFCGLFLSVSAATPAPIQNTEFTCELCTWITDEQAKQITPSSTEDDIIYVVGHTCSRLPAFLNAACNQFTTEYGPQMIHYLLTDRDAKSICRRIGICPN